MACSPTKLRYVADGKCVQGCGRPLATKWLCAECAAKHSARVTAQRRATVAAGKCASGCGRALATKTLCVVCATRVGARKRAHTAEGNCANGCGRARLEHAPRCLECWAKDIARVQRHHGRAGITAEKVLAAWEKSGGKCHWTGAPLTPGVTASLDHIIPFARGGSDELDNLVFADKAVNRTKRDSDPNEFMDVCKRVASHLQGAKADD